MPPVFLRIGQWDMSKRVCVFVDGENLRHSICDLFKPTFDPSQYLPKNAKWDAFFDHLVQEVEPGGERVRTYWYAIEHVDFFPFRFPDPKNQSGPLKQLLSRHDEYRCQLESLRGATLSQTLAEIVNELKARKVQMERRFAGWQTIQNGIATKHRAVEFRRAGAIRFDLFQRKLGAEKAVDVKLATDLIVLRDVYDVAIIVSGDRRRSRGFYLSGSWRWSVRQSRSGRPLYWFFPALVGIQFVGSIGVADPPVPFTEEALARGIDYRAVGPSRAPWPFGHGVAFVDLDADGDPDLVALGAADGTIGLFENDGGGHFANRCIGSGIAQQPRASGVTATDYDGDGDLDLYLSVWLDANMLLRNDGDFRFTDVAVAAGVADEGAGAGCTWADFDHDGHIDLYLTNRTGTQMPKGQTSTIPNRLYRNLGDGSFLDVAFDAGVFDDNFTFQAAFFDRDGDADADLYLSTDKGYSGIGINRLFDNVGGAFVEITAGSGTGAQVNSMGLAVGDFDGDMLQDLYCTNTPQGNLLYIAQQGGAYVEQSLAAGVASYATGWGAIFFDFDNDARRDLYVCNSDFSPNRLYRGVDAWPCPDVASAAGVDDTGRSFGSAVADIDADGDLDLLVENDDGPLRLYVNHEGQMRSWARFNVIGEAGNTHGVGAIVRVRAGATWQMREVLAGGNGYKSQNELTLHFGLSDAALVDEMIVHWPGGESRTLYGYAARQTWTLYPPNRLGDVDGDGVVSRADFRTLAACYGNGDVQPGCEMMDFDGDGDVDRQDYDLFAARYLGPNGDCNGNGRPDLLDILQHRSRDNNRNAIPDECELGRVRRRGL